LINSMDRDKDRAATLIPGEALCLRCLYQGTLPRKTPVVGTTPAVIGCVGAIIEVIKYNIVGIRDLLTSRLLIYDGFSPKFRKIC